MGKCDLELNDALARLEFENAGPDWKGAWARDVIDYKLGDFMGIDPGRNFGMAVFIDGIISVRSFKMEKGDSLAYGVSAWKFSTDLAKRYSHVEKVIIEGASYKDQYGQVGLAEIRFGFYLPFRLAGVDVEIVPPATIRKAVFGHGNCKASEIWPMLNHNAADALGAALFAAGYRCEKKDKD